MEMERQLPACHNDQSSSGVSGTCRGRGRGRARAHVSHGTNHMSSPGLSYQYQSPSQDNSKNLRYSNKAPYIQHDDRSVEKTRPTDHIRNSPNRVVNRTHERQNVENASIQNSEKSVDRQDKENSNSPRPQRSHRAHFDVGMVSRINRHLLQGINERSDSSANRSVPRKESSPPSSRASPDHAFGSPPNSTLGDQFASSVHMAVVEEQTSDLTPHPPAGQDEASTAGAVLGAVSVSPQHQAFHVQSPVSLTKAKGRGRARGRARCRQECSAPSPGETTTASHVELSASQDSHPEDFNYERFTDAAEAASGMPPESDRDADGMVPGDGDALLASEDSGVTSFASEDSGAVSSDTEEEHGRKRNRSPTGLTLQINVKETEVEVEDLCSPDDITQLLSPNHVYTLDWAAAMESPEILAESPPDWNS